MGRYSTVLVNLDRLLSWCAAVSITMVSLLLADPASGQSALDASSSVTSGSFRVAVIDAEPPLITCPSNIVVNTALGTCANIVNFDVTASDNCGVASLVCTPPSGSPFAKGVTNVACVASDSSGNSITCSFTVTVIDTESPMLTCPATLVRLLRSAREGCEATVVYHPNSTDNCSGLVSVVCTPASGSRFPKGTNQVSCTATDEGGNISACSFAVVVVNAVSPVLTCPPKVIANTAPGACQAIGVFSVSASGNCSDNVSVVCLPPSGSTFGVGISLINCTATDQSSNVSQCSFPLVVIDYPSVACPGNIELEFMDETGAAGTFSSSGMDNCALVFPSCYPPSGSLFPIGITPAHCVAVASSGAAAVCYFSVHVLGPRGLLERVMAELTALRATLTNRDGVDALDEAIRHLSASLDASLWVDETHLNAKPGKRVFDEDKSAVTELADLITGRKSPLADNTLHGFIERIVRAERLLALIKIEQAAEAGVNPKKIAEDTRELAKGDDAVDKGDYDEGLDHYRNAWQHALRLVVRATL